MTTQKKTLTKEEIESLEDNEEVSRYDENGKEYVILVGFGFSSEWVIDISTQTANGWTSFNEWNGYRVGEEIELSEEEWDEIEERLAIEEEEAEIARRNRCSGPREYDKYYWLERD